MILLGEDNWKFVLGLSLILPYAPFVFADFNLYPFHFNKSQVKQLFRVLNPSSESLKTSVVLGPPTHHGKDNRMSTPIKTG